MYIVVPGSNVVPDQAKPAEVAAVDTDITNAYGATTAAQDYTD